MPTKIEKIAKICDCKPLISEIVKVMQYNITLCEDKNWVVQAARHGIKYT